MAVRTGCTDVQLWRRRSDAADLRPPRWVVGEVSNPANVTRTGAVKPGEQGAAQARATADARRQAWSGFRTCARRRGFRVPALRYVPLRVSVWADLQFVVVGG